MDEGHHMVHSIDGVRGRLLIEGMCNPSIRMVSAYSFTIGLLCGIAFFVN